MTAGPAYRIVELPSCEGVADLLPRGINNRGDVVGQYRAKPSGDITFRAFLFDAATGITRRIDSDDHSNVAFAINDNQQVAMTLDGGGETEGVRWYSGVTTGIGLLPGNGAHPLSYAATINAAGWIAGWSPAANGRPHAVLWDGTTLRDLSPDAAFAQAYGMNSTGQAVGLILAADGASHAAAFVDGSVNDLGILGNGAVAWSISNNGRVVGDPAFIYDLPSGPLRNASPDRPATFSSVNSAGDVVGAFVAPARGRAILWHDGAIVDLTDAIGDPSWILFMASAINDDGSIAGWGEHNGSNKGFLLLRR